MEKGIHESLSIERNPDLPNKALRVKYAQEWNKLNDLEKQALRAARSRRGVCCDICGLTGYYRENCANGCKSPPRTPDSMDSTPPSTPPKEPVGLGILWGPAFAFGVENDDDTTPSLVDHKNDSGKLLRPMAIDESARLKAADKQVAPFEFFTHAQEGYNRNLPELTLHQVMRRLMRLIHRQLVNNIRKLEAPVDETLLHPPVHMPGEKFYPQDLAKVKAYRDYYYNKEVKNERRHNHTYKGGVRTTDALDKVMRGGGEGLTAMNSLYQVDKNAGQSMHSKVGWKSVLSHSDMLASSDPALAKKMEDVRAICNEQGKWASLQQQSMEQLNDRFEHIVSIIRAEMSSEHAREAKLLSIHDSREEKTASLSIWLERFESVDRIMLTLAAYGMTGGLDEADFLMYCLEKWKESIELKITSLGGDGAVTSANKSSMGELGVSMSKSANGVQKQSGRPPQAAKNKGGGLHNVNKMMTSGVSPYYQSDIVLEEMAATKNRRLQQFADRKAREDRKKAKQAEHEHEYQLLQEQQLREADEMKDHMHQHMMNSNDDADSEHTTSDYSPMLSSSHVMKITRSNSQNSANTQSSYGNSSMGKFSSFSNAANSVHSQKGFVPPTARLTFQSNSGTKQSAMQQAQADTVNILQKQEEDREYKLELDKRRNAKKYHAKSYVLQHTLSQREIDEENMTIAKNQFKAAHLSRHIRTGDDSVDESHLAPSLIPLPASFNTNNGGTGDISSIAASEIMVKLKKSMVQGDIGYTPQFMVRLYVRNTLREKNGSTTGGDQQQHIMATDRRYSHYMGRPLNRFEPRQEDIDIQLQKIDTSTSQFKSSGYGSSNKNVASEYRRAPLALTTEEKQAKLAATEDLLRRRQRKKMQYDPVTTSMVRMGFHATLPSLAELYYKDDSDLKIYL